MCARIAYFDCFSGASGDMILGALVDAGLPIKALSSALAKLRCEGIELHAETVTRGSLRATKVSVATRKEAHQHKHRRLPEIRHMLQHSELPTAVKERTIAIFTRLAEAEASVHGTAVEEVHFHEVGAVDAIADVVGTVAGMERLGIEGVFFSTLRLGGGTVECAHGRLPVPAPATAKLVEGFHCELGPVQVELLTPTGAAILTTLGKQQSPSPFSVEKIGYGAGDRENPGLPNVLRVLIGQARHQEAADTVWVVEANLDDATPEICGHAIERLLTAGALDAYTIPIQMKKSRPACTLCAIVEEGALDKIADTFFRETTTFGIRRHRVERTKLIREVRSVETEYGPVRVKVGMRQGEFVIASPEFEDCRRISEERGVPLRNVIELARRAFSDLGIR